MGQGAAIPVVSIHRLSLLYNASVKVQVSDDCHLLKFSYSKISKTVFEKLKNSLISKILALKSLDMLFSVNQSNNNGNIGNQAQASPFIMLVLAIVCQVKVSKYSERVV